MLQMKKIPHIFEGPYQGCTECNCPREASIHDRSEHDRIAGRVLRAAASMTDVDQDLIRVSLVEALEQLRKEGYYLIHLNDKATSRLYRVGAERLAGMRDAVKEMD